VSDWSYYHGPFRLYFNRHNEAPCVWSLDQGTQETEVNVEAIHLSNLPYLATEYFGKHSKDYPDYDQPSAVLHGVGLVRVVDGIAYVDGGLVPAMRRLTLRENLRGLYERCRAFVIRQYAG
jgi:hypothetical protein